MKEHKNSFHILYVCTQISHPTTHTHSSTHLLVICLLAKLFCLFSEPCTFCKSSTTTATDLTACCMSVNFFLSQVLNGHFVHYFAPKDLPAVPKNVVFVIDTSASMLGTKIRQVKQHNQWISMQSVSVNTYFPVLGMYLKLKYTGNVYSGNILYN